MSRFTDVLTVQPLADGKTWIICRDFGYDVGNKTNPDIINVPIGFMTDFASIPLPFLGILPRWGKYGNAAVIHDYLYWEQNRKRAEADTIFLQAMEVGKVGWFTRHIMYLAVKWFAGCAWKGNQKMKDKRSSRFAMARVIKSYEKAKAVRAPLEYVQQNIPHGVGKLTFK
jgi:hypothetical protein